MYDHSIKIPFEKATKMTFEKWPVVFPKETNRWFEMNKTVCLQNSSVFTLCYGAVHEHLFITLKADENKQKAKTRPVNR